MKKNKEEWAAEMRQYRKDHPEYRKAMKRYQTTWNRSLNGRFSFATSKARQRGLEWGLTKEVYAKLLENTVCHYCGKLAPETSTGLDRMNNLKGYIPGNVVVCCWDCNTMKGKFLTYDEMIMIWTKRRSS